MKSDIETYICGGSLKINAGDDAIHGEFGLTIDDGTINISTCTEALEAEVVRMNGGDVTLYATDDGVNASVGELYTEEDSSSSSSSGSQQGFGGMDQPEVSTNCLIEINGGKLDITMAQGDTDALDSNGYLKINGGTVTISAQFAFDYELGAELNGGTVTVNGQQVTQITESMMGGGGMGGQQPGGMGGQRPGGGMRP